MAEHTSELAPGPAAESAAEPAIARSAGQLPGRPRVVAVAITKARRAHVLRELTRVVAAGGSALLITADGAIPDDLPDGVEAIDLVADERRVGLHRVLTRSPARVLRRALGRPAGGPAPLWKAWSGFRGYRAVRPWVLWRALRRHLDAVDPSRVDHVVIVAVECWPITWQLCRLAPAASYAWDVPDEVFERLSRPVPAKPLP